MSSYRTALDADNAKQKAIREGVEMPKEAAFDSNCITPGTGLSSYFFLSSSLSVGEQVTNW